MIHFGPADFLLSDSDGCVCVCVCSSVLTLFLKRGTFEQFVGVRQKRPEAASVHLAAQTKKGVI